MLNCYDQKETSNAYIAWKGLFEGTNEVSERNARGFIVFLLNFIMEFNERISSKDEIQNKGEISLLSTGKIEIIYYVNCILYSIKKNYILSYKNIVLMVLETVGHERRHAQQSEEFQGSGYGIPYPDKPHEIDARCAGYLHAIEHWAEVLETYLPMFLNN